MNNIKKLHDIAEYLGLDNIVSELKSIDLRSKQENASIILPLVGEFSSGKTTLINALTDSKKLETATKPTTATIYEVHFGADKCHAKVMDSSGNIVETENLDELKNGTLNNAKVVTVFDTSKKVPSTTILVDTPGLSSPDPKHKQTLVDFLPQADAILLVSDINQQITRSIIDFIKTMSLSKRQIFLVLTKCDTKSPDELENAKKYISDNIKINLGNISCVSANNNDLNELYSLFNQIQTDKNQIIQTVNAYRIKNIIELLVSRIDELLNSTNDDSSSEESIRLKKHELDKLKRNIDNLIESMNSDIQEKGRSASRNFEDIIFERLDSLVAGSSNNFDTEAISAINNTSSLILNNLKNDIHQLLHKKAAERINTEDAVDLHSLKEIELSQYNIEGLNYNLNLNEAGHQYDGHIATGLKVAAAVAAVAVVATAAPGVLGAGGAAVAGEAGAATAANTAIGISTMADIADTVTDVSSIVSNKKYASKIQNAINFAGQASNQYSAIQNYNNNIGQQMGASKGIVESMVGFVTDKAMGKPQRRRAIHEYMDNTLLPSFKSEMTRITSSLVNTISMSLHQEANETIQEMSNAIEELKKVRKEEREEYNKRISILRNYKNELLTL